MRSVFAAGAAIFFAVNAIAFIPLGSGVVENAAQVGGLDGDPRAVAVTWAARTAFVGLALLSLAVVEWGRLLGAVVSRRRSGT